MQIKLIKWTHKFDNSYSIIYSIYLFIYYWKFIIHHQSIEQQRIVEQLNATEIEVKQSKDCPRIHIHINQISPKSKQFNQIDSGTRSIGGMHCTDPQQHTTTKNQKPRTKQSSMKLSVFIFPKQFYWSPTNDRRTAIELELSYSVNHLLLP